MSHITLFNKGDLSSVLRANEQKALEAVKDIPPNTVLTTPEADLVGQLYEKHKAEPLQLHLEKKFSPTGVAATKFDVSRGPYHVLYEGFGPTHVDGTRYELAVPFEGDEMLFGLRPSQYTHNPPQADIRRDEVVIVYEGINPPNAETIKTQLENQVTELTRWVDWSTAECRAYNDRLRPGLVDAVANQHKKVLTDREVEAALDYPVKRRGDPDPTFDIAVHRRRREVPIVSRAPPKAFVPEPAISAEAFADIVSVIRSMGLAAERFPETFGKMAEPVLREILLVVLNNQFGPSGGELFSRRGKTDVAIWHESGAVFIGECKIWKGEKRFNDGLQQLLDLYLVWRDTKAALVLFVRDRNVSEIQATAGQALREHPRWKRQAPDVSGCPVFILNHEGDTNREIDVALIVVAIPTTSKAS
jgi:hypothetical protein